MADTTQVPEVAQLRERYTKAIDDVTGGTCPADIIDAVLVVAQADRAELASLAVNAANALRDEKRHYEIACREIARLKDLVDRLGQTERLQRDRIARVCQMADAWAEQLPETIRTATAVDAIRTALETTPGSVS